VNKIKSVEPIGYKIIEIQQITHDTKSFKFELPAQAKLDFLPGDHMMMQANINGQDHRRPYTPSSTPDDNGFFEFIIKRYPNGLMSGFIHEKKVGDEILLVGPTKGGHFEPSMADKIAMIAGGAGVTPMIAIIRTILRRGYKTDMTMLFANKTEQDIILRNEFENYATDNINFRCVFTVDEPSPDWRGHSGFIDESHLEKHLPPPADNPLIFLCGPPMMEYKLRETVLKLGYEKSRLVIP